MTPAGLGVLAAAVACTSAAAWACPTGSHSLTGASAHPSHRGSTLQGARSRGIDGRSGAAAVSPSSTQLPVTGSDDLPIVALVGAAGVVTGVGVVRAARRRKTSSPKASG